MIKTNGHIPNGGRNYYAEWFEFALMVPMTEIKLYVRTMLLIDLLEG